MTTPVTYFEPRERFEILMREDLKDILFTEEAISSKVKELAEQITKDYAGTTPFIIGILNGAFIFLADLVRQMDLSCEIKFMSASSYGSSSVTSGEVSLNKGLGFDPCDRDVIIVEDILDTGTTLKAICEDILACKPNSLKLCCLLDKPSRRKVPMDADYLGFQCPDEFLVGYGLDYAGRYRNIPFIASLKPEIYS